MQPEQAIADFLRVNRGAPLVVAVSGGGDSMALLHLLAGRVDLSAVTVDHGLRSESGAEAAGVAAVCAGLGVAHEVLDWRWDGTGNLSDQARRGRLGLIGGWARARGLGAVAMAHTADDQAETFLMRLARGSGVDGLAAMASERRAEGVRWVRPLLGVRRAALRDYLTGRGVAWFDDPTNEDRAYQRVKARAALAVLEPLGIDVGGLGDTAFRLGLARKALAQVAHDLAREIARVQGGDVVIDRDALPQAALETQLRLLAHAIGWVASADYRPRLTALIGVHAALLTGKRRTLGGCLLTATTRHIRIAREAQAVVGMCCDATGLWDQRWRVFGPDAAGLQVAALGETGLAHCPGWRATGMPRESLAASPAIWRGAGLVAAPLAGMVNGWRAELAQGSDSLFTSLLSH